MMAAAKLENWAVERIIPYANNAKEHTPEQVGKIARAIETYGFDQPIVVDADGVIIKGHGRHLAVQSLGMKFAPVIVRRDLSPEQVRAARLSDNRVAMGGYNVELLQGELAALAALADTDLDLSAMGFDDRELDFLTDDLDEMNMDALVEDLDQESTDHSDSVERNLSAARAQQVPLTEAFGFKVLSVEQARAVRDFMAEIEDKTEAKGADALAWFLHEIRADE